MSSLRRPSLLALKGRNTKAQGAALGEVRLDVLKPCKGGIDQQHSNPLDRALSELDDSHNNLLPQGCALGYHIRPLQGQKRSTITSPNGCIMLAIHSFNRERQITSANAAR
jgi:hypothetical protein